MTNDLGALVVRLRATSATHINQHMGRAVQQFGLALLGRHDPALAQSIHDQEDAKPFTVSPLMRHNPPRPSEPVMGDLNPGDNVWVRFTGLSADVIAALDAYRQRLSGKDRVREEIDRLTWEVVTASWDDREWGGLTSYQALIDRHRHAQPVERLTLQFVSGTTFRSNGVNMPLPLPSLVFGSLLTRWETFTAHRLRDLPEEQLDAFITHHLLVSQHEIETTLYRGKQGSKEVGFIGTTLYELARNSDHLKKQDAILEGLLRNEYVWMARTIGLLADFAHYSGVGRKTTTGMGMARLR